MAVEFAKVAPEDVPRPYAVLALALALQALTFGILTYSFTFWVGPWTQDFGVPSSQVLMIVTGHMIALGACSALLGPWVDRIDARIAVITGLVASPPAWRSSRWADNLCRSPRCICC